MKSGKLSYFVTGTDTGSGKTLATLAIMQSLQLAGLKTCGMKPIASGCCYSNDMLVSEDALLLQKYSSITMPYSLVNPISLQHPCSPNIAAQLAGENITLEPIRPAYNEIIKTADAVIVEGIGGWRTPCTGPGGMADIVRELDVPVILVVGLRLGCINHALLTAEAVLNSSAELCGWIANAVDPDYGNNDQTVGCLNKMMNIPILGEIPYLAKIDMKSIGEHINHNKLLNHS